MRVLPKIQSANIRATPGKDEAKNRKFGADFNRKRTQGAGFSGFEACGQGTASWMVPLLRSSRRLFLLG